MVGLDGFFLVKKLTLFCLSVVHSQTILCHHILLIIKKLRRVMILVPAKLSKFMFRNRNDNRTFLI